MSHKFRVGVLGSGQIANDVHVPVLLNVPGVEIAWIADANDKLAAASAKFYGIPHSPLPALAKDLPPCDVCLIAIPVHARDEYYQAFAARGTAVLAEKPFAIGVEQHEHFMSGFPSSRVGCGYMRRCYKNNRLLRHCIEEGLFGSLRSVRFAEGNRAAKTGFDSTFQDRTYEEGGGALLAIGCHGLDLVLWLTGARSFEIVKSHIAWEGGTDRKVAAQVRLKSLQGVADASCDLDYCVSWLDPQDDGLELRFERVSLTTGLGPDAQVMIRSADGKPAARLEAQITGATTSYQAFYLEWVDFLQALEEGRPSGMTASSCLLTTRLIEELVAHERSR